MHDLFVLLTAKITWEVRRKPRPNVNNQPNNKPSQKQKQWTETQMTSALKKAKQRKSQHQQNINKVQCTLTTHLIDAAKLGYGKTRNVNKMAENVAGEKEILQKKNI